VSSSESSSSWSSLASGERREVLRAAAVEVELPELAELGERSEIERSLLVADELGPRAGDRASAELGPSRVARDLVAERPEQREGVEPERAAGDHPEIRERDRGRERGRLDQPIPLGELRQEPGGLLSDAGRHLILGPLEPDETLLRARGHQHRGLLDLDADAARLASRAPDRELVGSGSKREPAEPATRDDGRWRGPHRHRDLFFDRGEDRDPALRRRAGEAADDQSGQECAHPWMLEHQSV
jgi:hypothetical protein